MKISAGFKKKKVQTFIFLFISILLLKNPVYESGYYWVDCFNSEKTLYMKQYIEKREHKIVRLDGKEYYIFTTCGPSDKYKYINILGIRFNSPVYKTRAFYIVEKSRKMTKENIKAFYIETIHFIKSRDKKDEH